MEVFLKKEVASISFETIQSKLIMWYNHLIFYLRPHVSHEINNLNSCGDNTYNLSSVDKETHNNVVVVTMTVK